MFAALLYFITHTLIYRFGLFASGGYIIFLLPMAPAFTILAAFAIERIITWFTHASAQVPQRRAALAFAGVLMAAAFLFNLVVVLTTPPWRLQANEVAAEEAAEYLVANGYTDTPVYATHAWFFYVYENRGDLIRVPGGSDMKADDIPPNAFVLWDTQYGDLNSVDLAVLEAPNNGFTEVQRFYDDQLILFRKDD
jgi:hypothetical protein